jgi:hypothetical protein
MFTLSAKGPQGSGKSILLDMIIKHLRMFGVEAEYHGNNEHTLKINDSGPALVRAQARQAQSFSIERDKLDTIAKRVETAEAKLAVATNGLKAAAELLARYKRFTSVEQIKFETDGWLEQLEQEFSAAMPVNYFQQIGRGTRKPFVNPYLSATQYSKQLLGDWDVEQSCIVPHKHVWDSDVYFLNIGKDSLNDNIFHIGCNCGFRCNDQHFTFFTFDKQEPTADWSWLSNPGDPEMTVDDIARRMWIGDLPCFAFSK